MTVKTIPYNSNEILDHDLLILLDANVFKVDGAINRFHLNGRTGSDSQSNDHDEGIS